MDCFPTLHGGSTEPSPTQEYGLFKAVLILSFPVAATVDLMVSRIGIIAPLLIVLDHFGPIRTTLKSHVAVTGIKKSSRLK